MSENDAMTDPEIKRRSEGGVEVFEAEIDGETIQWDTGLTYARHIQTKALLSAQAPVSDKPDEVLFIIMHQTMELWMKLLLHEAGVAIAALRADRTAAASKTLDRMATVMRHMTHGWEVLATLTAQDFLTFRGYLRRASGFQSHQFRELEFRLGVKRPDMMLVHRDDAEATAALDRALREPSLYDEMLRLLGRRGFAVPPTRLDRDWSTPHAASAEIEDVWLGIATAPEMNPDLNDLAEKAVAFEYHFQEWRFKHMKTVARVIGHKPGTGGSAGVSYLVKSLDLALFPELWSMRTRMTAPRTGGDYADWRD